MNYMYETNGSPHILEAKMGLKRNRLATAIIIIQCVISLILVAICYRGSKQGNDKLKRLSDYNNKIHYSLHDDADVETFSR